MTNRKRRLKKGISSLQKQIDLHIEKKKVAEESGKEELARYYEKEIEAKGRSKLPRAKSPQRLAFKNQQFFFA